ncbi:PilN domain-containing protein [Zobellella maritima]|uniref:PilN domain-containing protein n=1 Tax=Zobellella maritima TaxID=2059725 RepID=UPI000E3063AA|nr:PilN domain-containing protein [Zobellella maritima]
MDGEKLTHSLQHWGQPLLQTVSGCWHWWTGQLFALLPARMRSWLFRHKQQLIVHLEQGRYRLVSGSLDSPLELEGQPSREQKQLLAQAEQIQLYLPITELLYTRLRLPAITAAKLSNVLTFEMDKHTPFQAQQVYFGYRILEWQKDNALILVGLLLIPKARLDPRLAELREMGIQPSGLQAADLPDSPVIPLNSPKNAGLSKVQRLRALNGMLILVMLLLVIAIPLYQRQARIESLSAELAIPKSRAEKTAQLKQQLEALQANRLFLVKEKASAPSVLMLLDELTRLLPDHTWLNHFELNKDSLQIRGESASASELIGQIEASSLFYDVRFSSPVTNNPATGKDRFMMAARFGEEAAP